MEISTSELISVPSFLGAQAIKAIDSEQTIAHHTPIPRPPIRCESPTEYIPSEIQRPLLQACLGLVNGQRLQLVEEGMSGTYFCRDRKGRIVAVFKPFDEEPCAPNNPKNLKGQMGDASIKTGVLSGEQAIREVAAFALDHGGLARVPPTIMVSINLPEGTKRGSFQLFVDSACPASDVGPALLDTRDVQAIAALDMRLLNMDRHDGNLLVQEAGPSARCRLVPIDHGCCLPDSLAVCWFEWAWFDWPQLRRPLVPAVRDAILALDVDADARALAAMGVRPACVAAVRVAGRFLQRCVAGGAVLADVARWMSRPDTGQPSPLEGIVARARWKAAAAVAVSRSRDFAATFAGCFEREVDGFLSRQPLGSV